MRKLFSFPNPVNELAARLVAGMVVLLATAFVITGYMPILWILTYGFAARVLSGPRFSPMGLIATKLLVPNLNINAKFTPGPPKRFAQAIGLSFCMLATGLSLTFGEVGLSRFVISILIAFASLEALIGFCTGCYVFNILIKIGIIPASVCSACKIEKPTVSQVA